MAVTKIYIVRHGTLHFITLALVHLHGLQALDSTGSPQTGVHIRIYLHDPKVLTEG